MRESGRELENLDALNAKEVLMPKKGEEFVFSFADGSVKLAGRDKVFRKSTSRQEDTARGEEHNDVLQGESYGSEPPDQQTADA